MNDATGTQDQDRSNLPGPWTISVGPLISLATALIVHARAWVPYREISPCHVEYSQLNWGIILGSIGAATVVGWILFKFASARGHARSGLALGSAVMFVGCVLSLAGHSHITERFSCHPASIELPDF